MLKDKKFKEPNGRIAGIDLGLRISAALSISGHEHAILFSGRNLLKEYDYWTRQISKHQKQLDTRKLKTSRRLSRLYQIRKRRLEHGQQSIAKAIAGLCKSNNVREVLIGWPKGIRNDVKIRKDWRGKIHNYWAFDKFSAQIEGALNKVGVLSVRVGERGTSSTCPWTQDINHKLVRKPRYKLSCKDCIKSMHSDAAGSLNMMYLNQSSASNEVNWNAVKATAVPYVNIWNKQKWSYRIKQETYIRPMSLPA